jgi:hypothetical protein
MATHTNLAGTVPPAERSDGTFLTDRQFQRHAITEQFLTALEDVVWRYRSFSSQAEQAELTDLCAEAVTAEVAHQLAITRGALHWQCPLTHRPLAHGPVPPQAPDQVTTSRISPTTPAAASSMNG